MVKRSVPILREGPIYLDMLWDTHLPMTLKWRNELRDFFVTKTPVTEETHRAWYAKYRELDTDFVFIINEAKDLHRPVGQVSLYNIDWQKKTAEFGRLMIGDPEARKRGLAHAATRRICQLADEWGLEEVTLVVWATNTSAIHIYEACGFKKTGEQDGLLHMRRRSWERWDDLGMASAIDNHWRRNQFETEHRRKLVHAVRPHLNRTDRVLEVGCGSGLVYETLVAEGVIPGHQYTGVDTSNEMLKLARARNPAASFMYGDAYELPFKDGSFDAVIAFEVLVHLPHIQKPIEEMFRVASKTVAFTVWDVHGGGGVKGFIHKSYSNDEIHSLIPKPYKAESFRVQDAVVMHVTKK